MSEATRTSDAYSLVAFVGMPCMGLLGSVCTRSLGATMVDHMDMDMHMYMGVVLPSREGLDHLGQ